MVYHVRCICFGNIGYDKLTMPKPDRIYELNMWKISESLPRSNSISLVLPDTFPFIFIIQLLVLLAFNPTHKCMRNALSSFNTE